MERTPITPQGLEVLREELIKLKTVERPRNIQAIEEARAHGDLSENAEFHAAKERQSFLEGRIRELEYKVASAEVICLGSGPKDRAVFGLTVVLENTDTGEEIRYVLVGPDESDIKMGRISVKSPLGMAILGKRVDDEIKVQVPGGVRTYVLVDIE